jgi:hypothetical protein
VLVRQWPVDAVVAENGAIRVVREGPSVRLLDPSSASERQARRARLARIVERVRAAVPEASLTDDVDLRRTDVTWDIGERARLPAPRVEAIAAEVVRGGARPLRSSVHLHATFDADDKASGTLALLAERFDEDSGAARARWAFVGDSTNDASCFAAFLTTFGVANVRAYAPRLALPPRYVAEREMGAGFDEIARCLLRLRSLSPPFAGTPGS